MIYLFIAIALNAARAFFFFFLALAARALPVGGSPPRTPPSKGVPPYNPPWGGSPPLPSMGGLSPPYPLLGGFPPKPLPGGVPPQTSPMFSASGLSESLFIRRFYFNRSFPHNIIPNLKYPGDYLPTLCLGLRIRSSRDSVRNYVRTTRDSSTAQSALRAPRLPVSTYLI